MVDGVPDICGLGGAPVLEPQIPVRLETRMAWAFTSAFTGETEGKLFAFCEMGDGVACQALCSNPRGGYAGLVLVILLWWKGVLGW